MAGKPPQPRREQPPQVTTARQRRKPTRVLEKDLSPAIRRLLGAIRKDLQPHGWTVDVQKSGEHLSFEFRNPLSPVRSGLVFNPGRPTSELKRDLETHISEEPEFAHTKMARPPRRKREFIGGLRWAATSYGWSNEVFHEVVGTLRHFRLLSRDEFDWLSAVGPDVLPEQLERDWRKHITQRQRGAKRQKTVR